MAIYKNRWSITNPKTAALKTVEWVRSLMTTLHGEFIAAGMEQTSDTGQYNFSSYTTNVTGRNLQGYTTYKIWSDRTWFMKVKWWTIGNNSHTIIRPTFEFGSGIDGAGNLTGVTAASPAPDWSSSRDAGYLPSNETYENDGVITSFIYKSDKVVWYYGSGVLTYSGSNFSACDFGFFNVSLGENGDGSINDSVMHFVYNGTDRDFAATANIYANKAVANIVSMSRSSGTKNSVYLTPTFTDAELSGLKIITNRIFNPVIDRYVSLNSSFICASSYHFKFGQEFLITKANGSTEKYVCFPGLQMVPFKTFTQKSWFRPALIWD